jgi:hypothetical protein
MVVVDKAGKVEITDTCRVKAFIKAGLKEV